MGLAVSPAVVLIKYVIKIGIMGFCATKSLIGGVEELRRCSGRYMGNAQRPQYKWIE
jgi:hypothetical protein